MCSRTSCHPLPVGAFMCTHVNAWDRGGPRGRDCCGGHQGSLALIPAGRLVAKLVRQACPAPLAPHRPGLIGPRGQGQPQRDGPWLLVEALPGGVPAGPQGSMGALETAAARGASFQGDRHQPGCVVERGVEESLGTCRKEASGGAGPQGGTAVRAEEPSAGRAAFLGVWSEWPTQRLGWRGGHSLSGRSRCPS